MNLRLSQIASIILIIFTFFLGIFLYPKMPSLMAAHWNAQGEINGYLPKIWVLFTMPALSGILFLFLVLIPKIDPLRENIKKFGKYFDEFVFTMILFLSYIYVLQIFWNLGYSFNIMRLLSPAFAILFFVTGILVKNSKQNWFIGIRTPWTLSDKKIWDKTNKLGGELFQFSAVLSLGGALMPHLAIYFVLIPVVFSSFFIIIYSYIIYTKSNKAFK